jgi:hypothetical protein
MRSRSSNHFQPSLRDLELVAFFSSVETLGYCRFPLRDTIQRRRMRAFFCVRGSVQRRRAYPSRVLFRWLAVL